MKQSWLLIVLGLVVGVGGRLGNIQRPLEIRVQRCELDTVPEPDDDAIRQIHDAGKLKTVLSSYMLCPKADAADSRGRAPKKWG